MIDMNLKEVIEQILPHYEKALIEMPKEGHYEWLEDRDMVFGICYFCLINLDKSITINVYRGRYIGDEHPNRHFSYKENLKQIQNRVDWMREYLSKN